MSLDKAIEHHKEKRSRYYGAKAIDPTCRNHGGCLWCERNRKYKFRDKHPAEREEIEMDDERNCDECIWQDSNGICTQWDCDYISRAEARKMVDAMRKENANAG